MKQHKEPNVLRRATGSKPLSKAEITKQAMAAIQSADWESYERKVSEDVAPKVEAFAQARRKSFERTLQYAVS